MRTATAVRLAGRTLAASALAASALALLPAATSRAGVVITTEVTDPHEGKDAKATVSTLYAMSDRLRMDTAQASVIFRDDKQVVWMLQPAQKTYMEMTAEQVAAVADQMNAAMQEMQAHMADMPPAQRAMIENMMKQQQAKAPGGGAAPAVPYVYASNGQSGSVNGWACKGYDATESGQVKQHVMATAFTNLDLTEADFTVFKKFGDFMAKLRGPMAQHLARTPFTHAIGKDGLPGVPIRTEDLGSGVISEIKKIDRQDVPSAQFELPAGWTKQEMGMGPGMMHHPGGMPPHAGGNG